MNKIYHSIWSAYVAVSEIAKGQGKRSSNRRKQVMTASSGLFCNPTLFTHNQPFDNPRFYAIPVSQN